MDIVKLARLGVPGRIVLSACVLLPVDFFLTAEVFSRHPQRKSVKGLG